MQNEEYFGMIECVLFVAGDPVPLIELQRALDVTDLEMRSILVAMDELYKREKRGVQLYMTDDMIQLVSNREYAKLVEKLMQPTETKAFSQSMLETLSIIAYRQPATRADIEAVRGVRCEYAVRELIKSGMVTELGRKNVVGRPMLLGTTDAFLRRFGLHSLSELPPLAEDAEEEDQPLTEGSNRGA